MNFVDVAVDGAGVRTASGDVVLPARAGVATLGVRPEDLGLHAQGPVLLKGRVSIAENLGELVMAFVDIGGAEPPIVKLPGSFAVKAGEDIALGADPARLHLFDATGLALRGNPLGPVKMRTQPSDL